MSDIKSVSAKIRQLEAELAEAQEMAVKNLRRAVVAEKEQPSDKEELESVLNRDQTEHGVLYVTLKAYKELEAELGEVKHSTRFWKAEAENCSANMRAAQSEAAEFKRRIASGELVSVDILNQYGEYVIKHIKEGGGFHTAISLQQFAIKQISQTSTEPVHSTTQKTIPSQPI
jgi:chromosome segregation ATPase